MKRYFRYTIAIAFVLSFTYIFNTQNVFALVQSQLDNFTYQNDGSAFGKYSGPITYYFPDTYTMYIIDDYINDVHDTSTGSYRNNATLNSHMSSTDSQGTTYSGISNDYAGLEDVNWRLKLCNSGGCWAGDYEYHTSPSHDYIRPYTADPEVTKFASRWSMGQLKNGPMITTASQSASYPSVGGGYPSGFTLSAQRSCSAKYVCTDSTHLSYRDSDCNYHPQETCSGICINGTCDPVAVSATGITTQPITPYTVPTLSAPSFQSSEGLQQCKTFTRFKSNTNVEWYKIDDSSYYANLYVPNGTQTLFEWTTFDSTSATANNQQPIYAYRDRQYLDDLAYYHHTWDPSSRILSYRLWPTGVLNATFRNETEYKQSGGSNAYGRGDALVLQVQGNYMSPSVTSYTTGNPNPPQVSPPAYFHYQFPTFSQCSPPAEITSITVQKSAMACADTTNLISWTPVAGADQYQVYIANITNPPVVPGTGFGEVLTTTTGTSYTYTAPTNKTVNTTYVVKIYAHNSKGWNISNSTTQFTMSASCGCTGPDGVTIANGASRTYYSTQTNPCTGVSRTCNNGTLSGGSTYIYPTCNHNCTAPDGSSMAGGTSRVFYQSSTTDTQLCSEISQTRTCNATTGVISGDTSYIYNTCTSGACVGPNNHAIAPGASRTYYRSTIGTVSQPCESEDRVCSQSLPHTLSGSFTADYCNQNGVNCIGPDGVTVMTPGQSMVFYANTANPCDDGGTFLCGSNGELTQTGGDPTATYVTNVCPVLNPCTLPSSVGGGTLGHLQTRRFYASPTSACSDYIEYSCYDGTLSSAGGNDGYTSETCSDNCTTNTGITMLNGSSMYSYSISSGSCSIHRTTLYCYYGVITGDQSTYPYGTCEERDCISGGVVIAQENETKSYSKLLPPPPCQTWTQTCRWDDTLHASAMSGNENVQIRACGDQSGKIVIGTYRADPSIVNQGGKTIVTVQVTGAKKGCTISGNNINSGGGDPDFLTLFTDTTPIEDQEATHTVLTGNLYGTAKYTLYCTDEDDVGASRSVSVSINPVVKER